MSITAECTACGRRYEAPASMAGKRVRCKQCGNIFALPDASFEEGPDLDALAAVEQSFHSVDATDAGGSGVRDTQDEDEDGERVAPLRVGRRNVRFSFPLAGELDVWLPRVLIVGGLIWLGWFCLKHNETDVAWMPYVRLATALIAFFAFVGPLTYIMIGKAARQLGYQLPTGDRFRSYAAYLPAFVIGYVMWVGSGGRLSGLILGCVAGVLLATLFLWLLFRLAPTEIAPSATYALLGFCIGLALVSAIYFGINTLILQVIVSTKNPDLLPASPFGPTGLESALAWISPEERQRLLDEKAKETKPAPTPAPSSPVPTPSGTPPPPPEPELPAIVQKMQTAPVGPFDDLIRPLTDSRFRGTMRRTGDSISVQVWNMDTWRPSGATSFTAGRETWENRYILSADGKLLGRIATFPRPSVQIWDIFAQQVSHVLDQPPRANQSPDLVGFVDARRLFVRWQSPDGSNASIDTRDTTTPTTSQTLQLASMATTGTTLVFDVGATLAAVATRVDSIPSLLIYDAESGKLLSTTKIDSLDPQLPTVTPTGMAFSADATQLALLFEQSGNGLLLWYQINPLTGEARRTNEWVYPAGPVTRGGMVPFLGNALQWLPDGKSWLLYGQSVFSVATGRRVGDVGVNNVELCWVSGTNTVELIARGPDGQRQYKVLQLNMERIATMSAR